VGWDLSVRLKADLKRVGASTYPGLKWMNWRKRKR